MGAGGGDVPGPGPLGRKVDVLALRGVGWFGTNAGVSADRFYAASGDACHPSCAVYEAPRVGRLAAAAIGWIAMDFTQRELEFLRSQRICRLATVGSSGWPNVVPVMFELAESGAFEFDVDCVKLRNLQFYP